MEYAINSENWNGNELYTFNSVWFCAHFSIAFGKSATALDNYFSKKVFREIADFLKFIGKGCSGHGP